MKVGTVSSERKTTIPCYVSTTKKSPESYQPQALEYTVTKCQIKGRNARELQ